MRFLRTTKRIIREKIVGITGFVVVPGLVGILGGAATQSSMASTALHAAVIPPSTALKKVSCQEGWVARLDSLQGDILVQRAQTNSWASSNVGQCFYANDVVKIKNGQAVFYLYNNTVMRTRPTPYQNHTEEVTRLKFVKDETPFLVKLWQGFLYFMTRTPQQFAVKTPYFNAFVDGTEFVVHAFDHPEKNDILGVVEGDVRMAPPGMLVLPPEANKQPKGVYSLDPGEVMAVNEHYETHKLYLRESLHDIQWLFYYPDVYVPSPSELPEEFKQILSGEISQAHLQQLTRQLDQPTKKPAGIWARSVGLALAAGQLIQAQAILLKAEKAEYASNNSFSAQERTDLRAYRALIALVQGDDAAANQWLNQAGAVKSESHSLYPSSIEASSVYWMVMSYWRQTQKQLELALEAAEQAVAHQPSHFLAQVRVAEICLMLAQTKAAENALSKAKTMAPNHYRVHTLEGMLALEQRRMDAAQSAFFRVTQQAPLDPMGHLGLGVVALYHNDLQQGRESLEVATTLAPRYELIRLYLSQAYALEDKQKHSKTQLDMAKALGPNDVMVDYFLALFHLQNNHPEKAIGALKLALGKIEARGVYRMPLALRGDESTLSALLAGIYRDVGAERSADWWNSASQQANPMNSEFHRQQAMSLQDSRLRETAHGNELLQAQIFGGSGVTPVNLLASEKDMILMSDAAPVDVGYLEYSPLLNAQRHGVRATLGEGTQNSTVHDVFIYGLQQHWRYAYSSYGLDTDGFRENDKASYRLHSGFLEYSPNDQSAFQFEVRDRLDQTYDNSLTNDERGDSEQRFELDTLDYRFSFRYLWQPHWRLTGSYRKGNRTSDFFDNGDVFNLSILGDKRIKDGQMQMAYLNPIFYGVAGIKNVFIEENNTQTISSILLPGIEAKTEGDTTYKSVYLYGQTLWNYPVNVSLGLSQDRLDDLQLNRIYDEINPKLGLQWASSIGDMTFAWFKHLQPPIEASQTLEPSHIFGMATQFDDADGDRSEGYLARWQVPFNEVNETGLISVEYGARTVDLELNFEAYRFEHQLGRIGGDYQKGSWLYQAETLYNYYFTDRLAVTNTNFPQKMYIYEVPLRVKKYWRGRWITSAALTYFIQHNDYVDNDLTETREFFQFDATLTHRLIPNVLDVSLSGYNLLNSDNEELKDGLFNSNTRLEKIVPERSMWLKFKLHLH